MTPYYNFSVLIFSFIIFCYPRINVTFYNSIKINSSFHISFLNDNSHSGRFLISRREPKQIIVHYLVYFDILKEELSSTFCYIIQMHCPALLLLLRIQNHCTNAPKNSKNK